MEKTSGDGYEEKSGVQLLIGFDAKLWPLSGSSHRGKVTPTDEAQLVSARWWVATNWVSGRMQQPSTELAIANCSVRSDFLWKAMLMGLGMCTHFSL